MDRRHFFRVLVAGAAATQLPLPAAADLGPGFMAGGLVRRGTITLRGCFDRNVAILHGSERVLTAADCDALMRRGYGVEAEMRDITGHLDTAMRHEFTGRLRFTREGRAASEWLTRPTC